MIKQPPRRVPLAYADKEKASIEDLKVKGFIRESVSPLASPIVLVSRKGGTVRPCVDYRKVNELVKPDGFLLPRIRDCLDAVAGSCFFSFFRSHRWIFPNTINGRRHSKRAHLCVIMVILKRQKCHLD